MSPMSPAWQRPVADCAAILTVDNRNLAQARQIKVMFYFLLPGGRFPVKVVTAPEHGTECN
jgi:hypothetical protein